MSEFVHGSCVAQGGRGLLFVGAPGNGKSDAALRLITQGWALVADDQVILAQDGPHLRASPPENLKGLLEVRGYGIVKLDHVTAPVSLVIELVAREQVERLPEKKTFDLLGCSVPMFSLHAFDASFIPKVKLIMGVNAKKTREMV